MVKESLWENEKKTVTIQAFHYDILFHRKTRGWWGMLRMLRDLGCWWLKDVAGIYWRKSVFLVFKLFTIDSLIYTCKWFQRIRMMLRLRGPFCSERKTLVEGWGWDWWMRMELRMLGCWKTRDNEMNVEQRQKCIMDYIKKLVERERKANVQHPNANGC